MKKFLITCIASLLSCSTSYSFWPDAANYTFEFGVGYRRDKLDWEIKSDTKVSGKSATLASKLNWHDLGIWLIDGRFKYITCGNVYFRANADYGWITQGKVTDKDYIGGISPSDLVSSSSTSIPAGDVGDISSIRSSEPVPGSLHKFVSSSSNAKRGHVYDLSLGFGYMFKMCDDTLALIPVVGYSWHGQHLEIRDGNLTLPISRSIEGLNSKYKTRWNGPWVGVDLDYYLWCDWSLFASYEFHWARYHAKGDWNLRSDLPEGFHHRSRDGHGQLALIGVTWDFLDYWTLSIFGEWKYFCARHGRDSALVGENENGDMSVECYASAPLKHVNWHSESITVNFGLVF